MLDTATNCSGHPVQHNDGRSAAEGQVKDIDLCAERSYSSSTECIWLL